MNTELAWLESIIVRRNLRALHLAINCKRLDNSDSDRELETSQLTHPAGTPDFYSAAGTEGSLFNPFDSPLASSELPALPHSGSSSPITKQIADAQQQLLDILTANIPSTTTVSDPLRKLSST